MTVDHARAWGEFWRQDGKSPAGGAGCLPARWEAIERAQRAIWTGFAKMLPRGARVLDLATGDGRVMGWMHSARRDLKLIGTDLAPDLPKPPRGTQVRAGAAMESLPFADGRFDGATSQFGFEYGDVAAVSAEIARVVRPRGWVGLLSHRGDGPILSHNLRRREAIKWAIADQRLVEIASRSVSLRASGLAGVPPLFRTAPTEGERLFGKGSAAWEIAEAVRRTMVIGQREPPSVALGLLRQIASQAENEMLRIASLEAACRQADDEHGMAVTFSSTDLELLESKTIRANGDDAPFGCFRLLRRR